MSDNLTTLLSLSLAFTVGMLAGFYLAYKFMSTGGFSPSWPRRIRRYDQVIKATIKTQDGRQGWFVELPEKQLAKLKQLAAGVINGKGLSGSTWSGHGKLFTRSEYESITQLMLDREWVRWYNPEAHNKGLEVTKAGLAALRCLAGLETAPHPIVESVGGKFYNHVAYTHTQTKEG